MGASGYATWAAPQVTTNAGQTVYMCERYDTNCETTGDVFYQNLTGLTPGTYKIDFHSRVFAGDKQTRDVASVPMPSLTTTHLKAR